MAEYVTKRIPEDGRRLALDEDEGRYFFTQILNGIQYCHQHRVAHRCEKWVWGLGVELVH